MRGAELPSFYKNMTFKEKVVALLNDGLAEKPAVFLIDLTITDSQKIIVALAETDRIMKEVNKIDFMGE